jgi:hypothetical protein
MKSIHIWTLLLFVIFTIVFIELYLCKRLEFFHSISDHDQELKEIDLKTGKDEPVVILFSGLNRYWEDTCKNHIDVIQKLTNNDLSKAIVGIHYWNNTDSEIEIPLSIRELKYKASTSSDNIYGDGKNDRAIWIIKKFANSSRIALKNAEDLYKEIYGKEMPPTQTVIRFRYDTYVEDIDNFPLQLITDMENYYLSNWNTNHRNYDKSFPEIADSIVITTKKNISLMTNDKIDSFIKEHEDKINNPDFFHERLLYIFLKSIGANIVFDFNLKLSLMRNNQRRDRLS